MVNGVVEFHSSIKTHGCDGSGSELFWLFIVCLCVFIFKGVK